MGHSLSSPEKEKDARDHATGMPQPAEIPLPPSPTLGSRATPGPPQTAVGSPQMPLGGSRGTKSAPEPSLASIDTEDPSSPDHHAASTSLTEPTSTSTNVCDPPSTAAVHADEEPSAPSVPTPETHPPTRQDDPDVPPTTDPEPLDSCPADEPASSHRDRESLTGTSYDHGASASDSDAPVSFDSSSGGTLAWKARKRQFPPRLPYGPAPSATQEKGHAVAKIKEWFSDVNSPVVVGSHPLGSQRHGPSTSADSAGAPLPPGNWSSQSAPSESDESDSSLDSGSEVRDLWRQLNDERDQIKETRAKLAELRSKLKVLRPKLRKADNNLMNTMRPILINADSRQQTPEHVQKHFERVQSLRTEVQTLEANYEELEDTLDKQQDILERTDVRFFSALAGQDDLVDPVSSSDAMSVMGRASETPCELLGIVSNKPIQDEHPLYSQLTLAVATLNSSEEYAKGLVKMKQEGDEAVRSRLFVRQSIPKDLEEFMNSYPETVAKQDEEIRRAREDVAHYKKLCEDRNIMPRHIPDPIAAAIGYPTITGKILDLDDVETMVEQGQTSLAHSVFNKLISQPEHLMASPLPLTPYQALDQTLSLDDRDPSKKRRVAAANKEVNIANLAHNRGADGRGTPGFINDWILLSLRVSPLNALVLLHVSLGRFGINSIVRWQVDVLQAWERDGTDEAMRRWEAGAFAASGYYSTGELGPRVRARAVSLDEVSPGWKVHVAPRRVQSAGDIEALVL